VFSPPLLRPTLLAIAFAGVALVGTWGSVQWLPLWADELVDKRLPEAKAFTQVSQSFGAILGCIVAPLIGGRLGRRPTYALLCAASLLLCQGMFHSVSDYGASFLVLAFFVGAASASFYGWLPLYLPELFPTRARATGQGVGFNTGRILAAVGAILGGQLVKYFGSYPQAGAVVTLVYVLGMVLIWLAPETKDKPLPD
jgi:MFS family permease